jgi:arylsulfatase A-like enzyme
VIEGSGSGGRPNVLIFMPDQLRADAVGAFGNPVARTPNFDAFAQRATRFTDAHCQHTVCSPSRASLLTGWYPHVQGHRTLTNLLKPWEPNLLRSFKQAGYTVAWTGQRGDSLAPGVTAESCDFFGNLVTPTAPQHPMPYPPGHRLYDAFYSGRVDGPTPLLDADECEIQTVEQWLAQHPPEPWLLYVTPIFPHCPFRVHEPWFSLHERAAMPLPVSADLDDKPRYMRGLRERYGTDRLSDEDWQEIVATYYGMVSRTDDFFGRVMRSVEAAGAGERTISVVTTDHGEYLGDYGLVEKFPSGLHDCLTRTR